MNRARYYLDHAATSWPKPPGSLEACIEYQQNNGAASGRGSYASAQSADKVVETARKNISQLIGARPECIGFTANGTLALNAAIVGLLSSASFRHAHVVTTATEHNSVLRPLTMLASRNDIDLSIVPCNHDGYVSASQIQSAMTPNTRLVIINHVSNVTGAIQDLTAIAEIAKRHRAVLLVDAAQSLGYLPIDCIGLGIDMLAAPGHKGAGGMLGTGVLYVAEHIGALMLPMWIGGTGTHSDSLSGPFGWREAFESGNLNVPALASLGAGTQWVEDHRDDSRRRLVAWTNELVEHILARPKLRLIGPTESPRSSVVSVAVPNVLSHELALLAESTVQVEARSGFHCAGSIHRFLGTENTSGTLRLSLGHTTTADDIQAAKAAIEILSTAF